MQEVKRRYAGESGNERAARRREALLDAAFDLVAADGWSRLRIDAVCRAAGLNKRYFYESFTGLDALAAGLMEKLAEDVIAVTLAAPAPGAARAEFVSACVTALVDHMLEDPRRARVLFGPAEGAATEHRDAAIRRVVAAAAAQGHTLPDLADEPIVELSAAVLVGGTSQAILDWLDGRLSGTRETFTSELVALWQMIVEGAARRGRDGA